MWSETCTHAIEVFVEIRLSERRRLWAPAFPELDKHLCDFLADVVQPVFARRAEKEPLTTVRCAIQVGTDAVKENDVEIRDWNYFE